MISPYPGGACRTKERLPRIFTVDFQA